MRSRLRGRLVGDARTLEDPIVTRTDRLAAARLLAACTVGVVALSGCGPLRAGAAAVVGSTRISTKQLAASVDRSLADPAASSLAADRPSFQRDVLGRMVTADVVEVAARRRGVTVTAGDVDRQYAALEQSVGGADQLRTQAAAAGLDLEGVRALARTRALTDALGDALTAAVPVPAAQLQAAYQAAIDTYDQVHVAQVQVASPAAAQALLPQAEALSDDAFAALARSTSLDAATRQQGGDLGYAPRSTFTGQGLDAYATAVFAAPVGATLAVPGPTTGTPSGYVVRVLDHRTTTLQQATPALRRTILQQQRDADVQRLLVSTAAGLHISVNPRFGAWDGSQLSIVADAPTGNREVSSPQAPAGGPAAGSGVLPSPAP